MLTLTPRDLRELRLYVRKRVFASHVDDVVSITLLAACESPAPTGNVQAWLRAIAHHRILQLKAHQRPWEHLRWLSLDVPELGDVLSATLTEPEPTHLVPIRTRPPGPHADPLTEPHDPEWSLQRNGEGVPARRRCKRCDRDRTRQRRMAA